MTVNDRNILNIAFVLIFAVAAFFSTYKLTESPPVWYDEGWYFQSANNLATTGSYGIQFAPGIITHVSMLQTVSYPLIYPMALWFSLFGANILTGRTLMVIFIILLLVAAYALSKRLFGNNVALGALAMLSTFPPLYGNGKSILGEVPGLFYLILFLLFFNIAKSSGKRKMIWLIISGLFAGLCIATKPMFFLLVPAIAVGVVIEWRRGIITFKESMIFLVACVAPIVIWLFVQTQPGDSIFSMFSYYADPYSYQSSSNSPGMLAVVWQSTKSLFTSVNTLYTLFLMAVWSISLFVRKSLKTKISGEEIISFCFAILVLLAFLRIGTILRYLFAAQVVALIFFPNALGAVLGLISRKVGYFRQYQGARVMILVSIIAILSAYGTYQLMFDSWVAEAYASHRTEFWQEYFTHVPSSTSVFFYDTPEIVPFISGRNYFQILLSDRAHPLGGEGLGVLESGGADMVIVENVKYAPLSASLFRNYILDHADNKYSVLKRK